MFDRRGFLNRSAAAAGVATLCHAAVARGRETGIDPAGVGGYTYRLPKFKQGSRLLFQGDSITDMKWGRNQQDRNHYLGHSYVYLIAARLGVDMPAAQLDFYNRGMSGHKVKDLRGRWQKDAIDMNPDLLSILIGVNDVGRNLDGVDVTAWEADYRFILDASRTDNPQLRIVLLDPFVVASGRLSDADSFKKWRDQVERLIPIVGKLASDYDAVHIKTQDVFDVAAQAVSPEQWIWDGVHPLPQGHELIARHWLSGSQRPLGLGLKHTLTLTLVIALLPASSAALRAADIRAGTDVITIAEAIKRAQPGDTIHLESKVYRDYAGFYGKPMPADVPATGADVPELLKLIPADDKP